MSQPERESRPKLWWTGRVEDADCTAGNAAVHAPKEVTLGTPVVGFSPKNGQRRALEFACHPQQSDWTQDIEWRNKKQTQNLSRR
jgi:hypothetical protein